MAKRWVKDEFTGDGATVGRIADTGQEWGVGGDVIRPTGQVTDGGVFTFNAESPGGYSQDVRATLIEPPTGLQAGTNVYEWWLPRFPDVAWGTPMFYTPAEALLCFESIGVPSAGGLGRVQAIQVGFDPAAGKMYVTSPNASRNDYGVMYNGSAGYPAPTKYFPLPDLDAVDHPAEYYFRLETSADAVTLYLNETPVYSDVSRAPISEWGAEPRNAAGFGLVLGNVGVPGSNVEPYFAGVWDYRGVIECSEFRLNYNPATDATPPPLHQITRVDGKNGSGNWQLAKRRGLWQYGGGQGWK